MGFKKGLEKVTDSEPARCDTPKKNPTELHRSHPSFSSARGAMLRREEKGGKTHAAQHFPPFTPLQRRSPGPPSYFFSLSLEGEGTREAVTINIRKRHTAVPEQASILAEHVQPFLREVVVLPAPSFSW